ncbi:MAG: hypothetical protein JWM34_3257 [Ilumatobacteraceae bacterium]|nr:hypothetical protein [Ilumatobacteraceae bacterium]
MRLDDRQQGIGPTERACVVSWIASVGSLANDDLHTATARSDPVSTPTGATVEHQGSSCSATAFSFCSSMIAKRVVSGKASNVASSTSGRDSPYASHTGIG